MTRAEQIEADAQWDKAWDNELAGARRRSLTRVLREAKKPTLRDLLVYLCEGRCDLADTPTAGMVRLGDLVHRDGEGPYVLHLVKRMGLGLVSPLEDAEQMKLAEIGRPLVELLD